MKHMIDHKKIGQKIKEEQLFKKNKNLIIYIFNKTI